MTIVHPLDLAALLCSRVCHDAIGPVGAIMNGLEMLDSDQDEDTRAVAMDLIKKSAAAASARLQFCRLAFGAAGSLTAAIDTGDAEKVARGLIANERTELRWNERSMQVPKNAAKLLLNLCLIAASAIPRGGVIAVGLEGEGADLTMTIEVTGTNVRLPQAASVLLTDGPLEPVDGRSIQPYYTTLLAEACKSVIGISASPESLRLTVSPRAEGSDQAEIEPASNADATTFAL